MVQRERDVLERECEREELTAWGDSRRSEGIYGVSAVFEEAGEGTKGSEAGSRTMEVTWPAKPSGLSNFRLDTSSSSHFAYQPRPFHVRTSTVHPPVPLLRIHSFFPGRDWSNAIVIHRYRLYLRWALIWQVGIAVGPRSISFISSYLIPRND